MERSDRAIVPSYQAPCLCLAVRLSVSGTRLRSLCIKSACSRRFGTAAVHRNTWPGMKGGRKKTDCHPNDEAISDPHSIGPPARSEPWQLSITPFLPKNEKKAAFKMKPAAHRTVAIKDRCITHPQRKNLVSFSSMAPDRVDTKTARIAEGSFLPRSRQFVGKD